MKKVLFSIGALLAIDISTKIGAQGIPWGGIPLFEVFGVKVSLNLVTNTGVAWGLFSGYPLVLLALRFCAIATLFFLFFFKHRHERPLWPKIMILAGAIGNAMDLLFHGYVIDFFHVQFWGWSFPVFNFADSCITIGALFLLFCSSEGSFFRTVSKRAIHE